MINYKIRSYQKAIDTSKLLNNGLSSSVQLGVLLQQEQSKHLFRSIYKIYIFSFLEHVQGIGIL